MSEESDARARFLLMVNENLVEEVEKYRISEKTLNKRVLQLEDANQELRKKWLAMQIKNNALNHEIFEVEQANTRLAKENKELHTQIWEGNTRLANENQELHTQRLWSTKSTAACMPNPYLCIV
jgi:hypothetical protein